MKWIFGKKNPDALSTWTKSRFVYFFYVCGKTWQLFKHKTVISCNKRKKMANLNNILCFSSIECEQRKKLKKQARLAWVCESAQDVFKGSPCWSWAAASRASTARRPCRRRAGSPSRSQPRPRRRTCKTAFPLVCSRVQRCPKVVTIRSSASQIWAVNIDSGNYGLMRGKITSVPDISND